MDIFIKQKIIESIEKRRDAIVGIGQQIFNDPETGFKEFHTQELVAQAFAGLGLQYIQCDGITGLKATIDTGRAGPSVAILGELDAIICCDHPSCNSQTGAVHACGHNTQIAALIGSAIGLMDSGVLDRLSGKIHLIAVPAEEFIEVAYRMELREKGLIKYLGGKPELMHRGFFDDVDLCIMVHAIDNEGKKVMVSTSSNGCLVKKINYIGKAAHAGGSPHEGINALYAANIGLTAINAIRETFREKDYIRIHPIITKGGEIVNVIPSDVRLETFVRGKTMECILAANHKADRAWVGGAVALGAKVEIEDIPGYFPCLSDKNLMDLTGEIITDLAGEGQIIEKEHETGSTDLGDLSMLMPVIQPYFGGAKGGLHSAQFTITDPDTAYLMGSEYLACMAYELLRDDAAIARKVVREYQPVFSTKNEYFAYVDRLFSKRTLPVGEMV